MLTRQSIKNKQEFHHINTYSTINPLIWEEGDLSDKEDLAELISITHFKSEIELPGVITLSTSPLNIEGKEVVGEHTRNLMLRRIDSRRISPLLERRASKHTSLRAVLSPTTPPSILPSRSDEKLECLILQYHKIKELFDRLPSSPPAPRNSSSFEGPCR
jgi:hypothetical protein